MNLFGLLSLIFGVVGMCLSCIVIGIIPCAISLIFAFIALAKDADEKWSSICGIACSAVGIAMFAIVISQTDEYKHANVATPTEIVNNISNGKETNSEIKNEENNRTNSEAGESENEEQQIGKAEHNEEDSEKQNENKIINADFDTFSIKYVSHEVSTDYDGNPCLIVYFDFTNNKDEPTSASMSIYSQVFQNGVECELAFVTNNDYIDNASKDIQKGTTIRVGTARKISDMSDIDILLKEAFSFSNKSDEMKIKLN